MLNGLYMSDCPYEDARYSGLTRAGYTARRRLHQAQVNGVSRCANDFFHVSEKKRNAHRSLFWPFADYDDFPDLTTEKLRIRETRSFLLLRVNQNTQNQHRRGKEDLRVVH